MKYFLGNNWRKKARLLVLLLLTRKCLTSQNVWPDGC